MTVKELIEKLQELDGEKEIRVDDTDSGTWNDGNDISGITHLSEFRSKIDAYIIW